MFATLPELRFAPGRRDLVTHNVRVEGFCQKLRDKYCHDLGDMTVKHPGARPPDRGTATKGPGASR